MSQPQHPCASTWRTLPSSRIVCARVPATVLLLLIIGAVLAVGMVGFNAGLSRKHSMIGAIALIVILGAVITPIVDLDGRVTASCR